MATVVIISPHIDDAVFSLGSYLEQLVRHHSVSVINVFSLSTFAFREMLPPRRATLIREFEDGLAMRTVGVPDSHYLRFPEALLRGYSLVDLRSESAEHSVANSDLVPQVSARLVQLVPPDSFVLAPAAFGSNVDHIVTRMVCERLAAKVVYYADLPYAADAVHYSHRSAENFLQRTRSVTVFSGLGLANRNTRLCRLYISQFEERFVAPIEDYLDRHGITLWSNHGLAALSLDI
ncbi:MAG: PIG-L family deacetylase [Chloroflexi bacterium]|nr:PIG-L family deacetylase [Chloroflexota bacterium]